MSNQLPTGKKYFDFTDEQKLQWLRLYRSQNVGPATFRDLVSHFGTAAAALDAIPELAKRGGASARIKICAQSDAEREMHAARNHGAEFITIGEAKYPALLRNLEQSPPLLCVKGSVKTFEAPALAIVGSRNASISGMKLTDRFSYQMGERGYCIVSGLARGIDTAAHKAALKTGTIAVFAGGVDVIFPKENRQLSEQIVEHGGALVSEMPMGWEPKAKDFPRRNRIVTGLASAVLVIEAAKRSGSLISARLANEAGRLVLATPGSPLDPRSEGTNGLIREGATLVTSVDDILEAIAPTQISQEQFVMDISEDEQTEHSWNEQQPNQLLEPTTNLREQIISSISSTPIEIDDIIRFTGAAPGEVQLVLLELSLAGRLERHSGNRISLL